MGRDLLGIKALDAFPISSAVGQAYGVAYVLPNEPSPNGQQLAPIATAQGLGLVCGGYTHDADLMAAADLELEDFVANPVKVEDLFSGFGVSTGTPLRNVKLSGLRRP